ncbi:hypothetical protein ES703_121588 [subsurface metagenome]
MKKGGSNVQFTEDEIKMAEKAVELQGGWQPQAGDWFFKKDGIGFGLWLICDVWTEGEKPHQDIILRCSGERMHDLPFTGSLVDFRDPPSYIWLPLEHQLWEMAENKFDNFVDMLESFYWSWAGYKADKENLWREFIEDEDKARILADFTSMWELLLVFVMHALYGKVWNGEDWVKK